MSGIDFTTLPADVQAKILADNGISQPASGQRTDPSASDLLRALADALDSVIANGRSFTAYSVTQAARAAHPEFNISHDAARPILHGLLRSNNKLAVGVQSVNGHDSQVYTPLA